MDTIPKPENILLDVALLEQCRSFVSILTDAVIAGRIDTTGPEFALASCAKDGLFRAWLHGIRPTDRSMDYGQIVESSTGSAKLLLGMEQA